MTNVLAVLSFQVIGCHYTDIVCIMCTCFYFRISGDSYARVPTTRLPDH